MDSYCNVDERVRECESGKYNLKDGYTLTDKTGKGTMVRLKPEQFMQLTMGKRDPSRFEARAAGARFDSAEGVNEAMCSGEPIDPMYLSYDQEQGEIVGHEGRMRAYVADKASVDSIPVKLFCEGRSESGRITAEHCNVSSGRELVSEAEPQSDVSSEKRYKEEAELFKQECG